VLKARRKQQKLVRKLQESTNIYKKTNYLKSRLLGAFYWLIPIKKKGI